MHEDVEWEHGKGKETQTRFLFGDEKLFLSYLTGNGCSTSGEWSSEMIRKEVRRRVDSAFPILEDCVSGSFFF